MYGFPLVYCWILSCACAGWNSIRPVKELPEYYNLDNSQSSYMMVDTPISLGTVERHYPIPGPFTSDPKG